ncbi:FAD-dependent oxidoreductase, partial [Thioclava sp. BHET1]
GIPAALRTLLGSTTAPRSRGALLIKIGLAMYDFYGARHRVMPRHALWSRKTAHAKIPPLSPRIVAAGTYYDAQIVNPERLVLELVEDGLAASPGSRALSYARLTGRSGDLVHLQGADGRSESLRPRIVVNAAGPWIDSVNAALGEETHLIGGTKGSHILLDHPELLRALDGRMIYFEADDGRICLVFDYLGRALVGSTDIRAEDPDNLRCEAEETAYFLAMLAGLFPSLPFAEDQIVYSYSGIRPLPASDAANPGLISRDHSAPVQNPTKDRPFPILSLVGGKWTTFRGFAEEVCDQILTRLGQSRRISTRALPIGGGRAFPTDAAARATWIAAQPGDPARAGLLLARYGTRAAKILAAEASATPLAMLQDAASYSNAEIAWIAAQEQVQHLADIVLRRTALAITGHLSRRDLEQIAEIAGATLEWSDDRRAMEIVETAALLARDHGVTL